MKLSTRCRYGSRALLEIGRNYGKCPTKRRDICSQQDLSDSYLENILISLKSAGVIDTIRGAKGGYVLTRPPSKVTLLEVAKALEGSQAPVECLDNASLCGRSGKCVTQDVWRRVRQVEEDILGTTTIQDLIEKDRVYAKSGDYSI